MDNPILYRKRLIPNECILLKDDEILFCDHNKIVTKWNALKPKIDLHHGYSCYFLQDGYKVSKFFKEDGTLLYWYCDIVDYQFVKETNSLFVTDLLVDVVIFPDGFVKVLDIEELVAALDNNLITVEQLKIAILRLNELLSIIYNDQFNTLKQQIEQLI